MIHTVKGFLEQFWIYEKIVNVGIFHVALTQYSVSLTPYISRVHSLQSVSQ